MQHKAGSSGGKNDGRSLKANIIAQIPGAIRVCGDWSEQLSSNGKLYFFNIKTKSSQWERPKDWSNSRAIDVKKEKSKLQHNRASLKHSNDTSSGGHHTSVKSYKGHVHNADAKKLQGRQRLSHDGHSNKEFRDRDYRTSNSNVKDRDYRDLDYRDKTRQSEARHADLLKSHQTQDRDYRSANCNHETRHGHHKQIDESISSHGKSHTDKNVDMDVRGDNVEHRDNELSKDERMKSNSSTPMSSQDVSKAASMGMDLEGCDGKASANGGGSSALVQTLSSVLNQANMSSVEEKTDSTSIEGNLKNALQMLLNAAAQSQQIPGTSEQSEANCKEETKIKKPRLAHVTDDHISRSVVICKSAEKALESLRGFYDERYTNHVQGWSADQMERQSVRLCDENHQFVVNHTSQLSTSMKMSRSKVRSAEIHSTMQEQRILYLRQQIKDLEKTSTTTPFT